ncbi:MAG: hypothetical protein IJP43_03265, partial [Oscillospiraceae bacterium]|nr:hypothetical protein [Oscillospiraceae bacterium]
VFSSYLVSDNLDLFPYFKLLSLSHKNTPPMFDSDFILSLSLIEGAYQQNGKGSYFSLKWQKACHFIVYYLYRGKLEGTFLKDRYMIYKSYIHIDSTLQKKSA